MPTADVADARDLLRVLASRSRAHHRTTGPAPVITGVNIVQVPGDGHCLFHAIGKSLATNTECIASLLNSSINSIQNEHELSLVGLDDELAGITFDEEVTLISESSSIRDKIDFYTNRLDWIRLSNGGPCEMLLLSRACHGMLSFSVHQGPGLPTHLFRHQTDNHLRSRRHTIEVGVFHCNIQGREMSPTGCVDTDSPLPNHYDLVSYTINDNQTFYYWPFAGLETDDQRQHRYQLIEAACAAANAKRRAELAATEQASAAVLPILSDADCNPPPTSEEPLPRHAANASMIETAPINTNRRSLRVQQQEQERQQLSQQQLQPRETHSPVSLPSVEAVTAPAKPRCRKSPPATASSSSSAEINLPAPMAAPTPISDDELIFAHHISTQPIISSKPIHKTIKYRLQPLWIAINRICWRRYLVARDNKRTGEMISELGRIFNLPRTVLTKAPLGATRRHIKSLLSHPPPKDLSSSDVIAPPPLTSTLVDHETVEEEGNTRTNDPDARKSIIRACRIIKEGAQGCRKRAMKCLSQSSQSLPVLDDELLSEIMRLHPQNEECDLTPSQAGKLVSNVMQVPPLTSVDLDMLRSVIHTRVNNGSAPGPSGWTGDHLEAIMQDDDCANGVAAFVTDIFNGSSALKEVRDLILGSVLITPRKPNGSIRPIAMGEVLYKTAAHYAMQTFEPHLKNIFPSIQFGISVPGGSERAANLIRNIKSFLDVTKPNEDTIILGTDFANAFNATSRAQIRRSVLSDVRCRPIWRLFEFAYGDESPLHLFDANSGDLKKTIFSRCGVRQGDPLAAFAFAHTVQPMYTKIKEQFPNVFAVAIQDDLTLIGPSSDVFHAFDLLHRESPKLNLRLQPQKCSVLLPQNKDLHSTIAEQAHSRGLQTCSEVFKVLGTYIACAPEHEILIRDKYLSEVDEQRIMFERLAHPLMRENCQTAYALLRSCALPRMNFATRSVEPKLLEDAAKRFDELTLTCFGKLADLTIHDLEDTVRTQISLPLRQGGLGLRPTQRTMHPAYLSASLLSLTDLIQYLGDEGESRWQDHPTCQVMDTCIDIIKNQLKNAPDETRESIAKLNLLDKSGAHLWKRLRSAITKKDKNKNKDKDKPNQARPDPLLTHIESGLQNKLVHAMESSIIEEIKTKVDQMLSDHDRLTQAQRNKRACTTDKPLLDLKIRLVALSTPHAARAFTVLPTEPCLTLSAPQMRCAFRMRLGLIPKLFMREADCDCDIPDHPYVNDPQHLHSCSRLKGTGVSVRHDLIKNGLANALRELGASVIVEPTARAARVTVTDDESSDEKHHPSARRADLLYLHAEGCGFIDISVTHPMINKLKRQKSKFIVSEPLVAARAAELHKTKKYDANGAYTDFPVTPAILETLGGFGPAFVKLLKTVSKFDDQHSVQATFERLADRVAVLLAKGNHALELTGVPKAMAAYARKHFAPFYARQSFAVFD